MSDQTTTPAPAPHGPPLAKLDNRPLWRVFLVFLGPMILANILQSLSGTLNNVFVGQMLGTQALAAVAGMFPIIFFLISLVIGIGAGASVLIGQAWGAHEPHKVKAIAGTALALGLLLGLAVALFGGTFTEAMLRALGTPADVLPLAVGYARMMMLAMPGLLVFILLTQLMRGVGDTLTPLYALVLSTSVSCIFTPAFIRGWWGLPQLGVTSAAAASIISFICALLFLAWFMRRRMNQPMNSSAATNEPIDAVAADVTPSCGSPPQPRMKAGVSTHETAVDSSSAYSGVTVSPTPRISCVARMKTSSPGIANIITRA